MTGVLDRLGYSSYADDDHLSLKSYGLTTHKKRKKQTDSIDSKLNSIGKPVSQSHKRKHKKSKKADKKLPKLAVEEVPEEPVLSESAARAAAGKKKAIKAKEHMLAG